MEIGGIYREFRQSLLAFIRTKVSSKEDAEDILQDVFIRVAGNIQKLKEKEKMRSWMYKITRNAIIDYYRANSNKRNIGLTEDLGELLPQAETIDDTKGLDTCMNTMIALLPEEYRGVIIDAEIKGIKQKDLANKYNIAYPSLRSRVQRGRERLKHLFQDCCHIEADSRGNIIESSAGSGCTSACSPCSDK